ncbi:IS4 family transposase [Bacillus thuringiensis]|uniref:IS4 family transposase n=1 Tax=Bacillus thuringiensis TaxID=1428 RepID=UPI0004593948|nr:IS4 family transposase [Bacillus thuringiensis]AHZ54779.1 transposase for insertion sequence element IS231C [Bacillus thuringiensis serovar kurstaki str. YBT-1520]AIM34819.1 transposase for insertion sequence element [Bacillus thuringiensis serovar kurstaki str. YBT-1520]UQM91900.1 IS4 family transposase [Bacillus thuringiensis]
MNLSIQDELQLFSEELYRHLTPSLLEELAKELGFVKRKRKFSGNELATICIWVSQRTASDSLVRLCSQLHAATGTLMSPEGLNKRFDKKAVEFLKYIFSALWKSKLCKTSAISSAALTYFQRIRILDATIFQVPKHLAHVYPGSGGCAQTAGIKIQLEYDLHSGQFLNFQVGPGKNNDKTFGTDCLDTLRPGDLCIRDLGYFSLEDLDQMDQRGVCYISRLKLNHTVYTKNPFPEYFRNGTIKKQSQYIQVDLENIMHTLKPGQTYEIKESYIGKNQRLFTRVIIYRLTEEHHWQTIKQERLECHVYGKLIAIFICSSTMFKMRQLLLQKHKRELSEYKAIGMIQDHLSLLYQAIQRNTRIITKVLIRLFTLLKKNGRKSHRYEKKTIFDIMGVVYEYNGLRKQKKAA